MNIWINTQASNHTEAIQAAIDDCFLAGGGTVSVEAGEYRIGGLRLRSNVTLYLKSGAKLIGTRDIEAYDVIKHDTVEPLPASDFTDTLWSRACKERDNSFQHKCGSRWSRAVIKLAYAKNAAIIGEEGSIIDGSNSFDEIGEEHYRGVHGISMYHCENLTFKGYTIKDTGNWAHCAFYSKNLEFSNLTILAGHDGIHLASCDSVSVSKCEMHTGDDCVAGFDILELHVKDCIFSTACSSFRLGGTNILIEDCKLVGPPKYTFRGSMTKEEKRAGAPSQTGRKNTLSAFTYYADFTLNVRNVPENIVMRNCSFDNLSRFLHYNFSGSEVWQMGAPLKSVVFENVTATNLQMSLCAYGDENTPVSLTVKNSIFTFETAQPEFIRAANFENILLDEVKVVGVDGATVTSWGGEGTLAVTNCEGIDGKISQAAIPFETKSI